MGWLTSLLLPCSQPRKPTKDSSIRSNPSLHSDPQRKPTYIDSSGLSQKPNRIARKPAPQATPSIRIVEYSDSEPTLEWDEKDRSGTGFSDAASFFSDDRTILMPEPDEEAVLMEMRKIEKDLAVTAPPPPLAVTMPRRASRTTTRTSACLDMFPEFRRITEAIREEQEPEESPGRIGTAVTTSPEEEASKTEAMNETAAAQQKPQEKQEHQEQEQEHEQEPQQAQAQEPEPQPDPVAAPEPLPYKKEQDHHLSCLSTRLSRRRSLIDIFNAFRASQRSSFRLNLEFSPKFYSTPFSPSSPTSSTTAFSPPMSPVSTISPLSPTLSDETIMVDAIETACAVQIAGRKGPQEVMQGKEITPDEGIFQFR